MDREKRILQFRGKTIDPNKGDTHPLLTNQGISLTGSKTKASKKVVKLTSNKSAGFVDPLQATITNADEIDIGSELIEDLNRETEDAWRKSMNNALMDTGVGKIKIQPPLHEHLLNRLNKSDSPKVINTPEARLDWLESNRNGATEIPVEGVTQQEFLIFMEACNQHVDKCWLEDHRVQVVKTAIQLAKMLAPEEEMSTLTDVYQCIYFSVTDLISFFGKMVYDRLLSKCPTIRVNFCYEDVSPQAKELCKNWLYKIASVREVVPRFYLETALLKCYKFSCDRSGFSAILERLTIMIRGFGEPISAAYARLYLVHTAEQAFGPCDFVRENCRKNYEELLRSLGSSQRSSPLELWDLPLQWLIRGQTFGLSQSSVAFGAVIRRCFNEFDNLNATIILVPLFDISPPDLINAELTRLAHVVLTINCDESTSSKVMKAFLVALRRSFCDLKKKDALSKVIDNCWARILERRQNYSVCNFIECTALLVELILLTDKGSGDKIDIIFGKLLTLTNSDGRQLMSFGTLDTKSKELVLDILLSIISSSYTKLKNNGCVSYPYDGPSNFLPLFDCLDLKQQVKIATFSLSNYPTVDGAPDKSTEYNHALILRFANVLASSVNALTISDETRQIGSLICRAIEVIDCQLENDFEQRLKYYTNCRADFKRLDSVLFRLIHMSMNLALLVRRMVNQSRAKGFMQACIAFSFITVPSLFNAYHQLQSYLLTAQVAFQCRCLGQAEACITAVLKVLESTNKSDAVAILNDFLPNFLSYVVVVPQNTLESYSLTKIVRKVLKSANSMTNASSPTDQALLISLYIKAIQAINGSQRKIAYHINGFVTNNLLRHEANDGEIDLMCNDLVGMIIIRIDYLFEQNCSSLGYFASVQLLLCLQNHFPKGNSGHHERVKEIQDKIENSRCQLDKKSSALYNFYLETV